MKIRKAEARDEPRWRELWDGYTRFYEREPNEAITRHTWTRILDPKSPVDSIVIEDDTGRVIGLAKLPAAREHVRVEARVLPAGPVRRSRLTRARRGQGDDRLAGGRDEEPRLVAALLGDEGKQTTAPAGCTTSSRPHSGFLRYQIINSGS
jgi:hypothetical protein